MAGDTLVKQDQYGVNYTFKGGLGLCPSWKNSGISNNLMCREYLSACLMALINTAGAHVPIYMAAKRAIHRVGTEPELPEPGGDVFRRPDGQGRARHSRHQRLLLRGSRLCHGRGSRPHRRRPRRCSPYKNRGLCQNFCTTSDQKTGGNPTVTRHVTAGTTRSPSTARPATFRTSTPRTTSSSPTRTASAPAFRSTAATELHSQFGPEGGACLDDAGLFSPQLFTLKKRAASGS